MLKYFFSNDRPWIESPKSIFSVAYSNILSNNNKCNQNSYVMEGFVRIATIDKGGQMAAFVNFKTLRVYSGQQFHSQEMQSFVRGLIDSLGWIYLQP